jgi:hypothetical protein
MLSFTILTTEAHEDMHDLHTRMPMILDEQGSKSWLEGNPRALSMQRSASIPYRRGRTSLPTTVAVKIAEQQSAEEPISLLLFWRCFLRLREIGSRNRLLARRGFLASEFLSSFLCWFLSCRHGFTPFASLTGRAYLIRSCLTLGNVMAR